MQGNSLYESFEGIDLSKIKLDYFYTDSEKDDDEN